MEVVKRRGIKAMNKVIFPIVIVITFIITTNVTAQNFWQQLDGPYDEFGSYIGINAIGIDSEGIIYAGANQGIFRSSDSGDTWKQINKGLSNGVIYSLAIGLNRQLFAVGTAGIFLSSDNGDQWKKISGPLVWVYGIAIDVNGNIFAGNISGIFRSKDMGISWVKVFPEKTNAVISTLCINNDGHILAGARDSGIYRSSNSGDTWEQVQKGFAPVSVISRPDGYIFAATWDHGVIRSTNNGDTWEITNLEIVNHVSGLTSLGITPSGDLVAGANEGVFFSTDNGESWSLKKSGLPDPPNVWALPNPWLANSKGYIFVGTGDHSVFRSSEPLSSVHIVIDSKQRSSRLYENYSNPVNALITFTFSVTHSGDVLLKVFDLLGNEIVTLVNDQYSEGEYKVDWNVQGLSSGIYFCRFQSGSFVQAKKVMVWK